MRTAAFTLMTVVLLSAADLRAYGNDSSALLAAGGRVLTRSDAIAMESEDLRISQEQVRVAYLFRNTTAHDVRTRVAFPVPPLPVCADPDMGECSGDIEIQAGPNPMRFKLWIDGRSTPFETEEKTRMGKGGVGKKYVIHHWDQVFPAGRAVAISHEYVPISGGWFTDTGSYSKGAFERDMTRTYCVGPTLLKALTRDEQSVSKSRAALRSHH